VATVVVHNIAVTLGEDEPADDNNQLQQYVTDRRLQPLADSSATAGGNADIDPPAAATANHAAATSMRRALIDSYFA